MVIRSACNILNLLCNKMICSSSKTGCYNLSKLRYPGWLKRPKTANSVKASRTPQAQKTARRTPPPAIRPKMRTRNGGAAQRRGTPAKPGRGTWSQKARLARFKRKNPKMIQRQTIRAAPILGQSNLFNRANCEEYINTQSARTSAGTVIMVLNGGRR